MDSDVVAVLVCLENILETQSKIKNVSSRSLCFVDKLVLSWNVFDLLLSTQKLGRNEEQCEQIDRIGALIKDELDSLHNYLQE